MAVHKLPALAQKCKNKGEYFYLLVLLIKVIILAKADLEVIQFQSPLDSFVAV